MNRMKYRIVPAVSDAKYEIEYSERPSNFGALTIWAIPDELNFAVQQLEDAKRKYCIEHRLSSNNDNKIRVWSKSFTGFNWYEGK